MPRSVLALLLLAASAFANPALAADLLVGNKSADTVWRLSLEDGRRIGAFPAGPAPHEIVVSPDGRLALVTHYGGAEPGRSVGVLDLETGRVARRIRLDGHARPHGIRWLPDGRAVVTAEATGSLLVLDVAGGTVESAIEVGDGNGHMVEVSADGGVAYVSKIADGTVSRVDLAKGEVTHVVESGAGAEGLAVHPLSGDVWVGNREADTVTVHDAGTLALRHTLQSEGFPIRVVFTPDGRHALVTNARAATLAVFDAETRERVAEVPLAREGAAYRDTLLGIAALPIGVVADPAKPRVYVAISGADEIAVIDTNTWTVIDHWPTGREPDALAIVP